MSVIVVGSANLDLVYGVERIPAPGETVLATRFEQHPGGKGNNQVSAVARAGAPVTFIAALGADAAGDAIKASLADSGVTSALRSVAAPTGTALITVDASAENTIIVNSGANAELVDLSADELAAIAEADYLLLQLETPLPTVIAAATAARANGTIVALNAAPIRSLPTELLAQIDLLIVNEHEAGHLARDICDDLVVSDQLDIAAAEELANVLATLGTSVIITLGANGALVLARADERPVHVPGIRVSAVDTTGAGDTFCGALIAALDATGVARTDTSATDAHGTGALATNALEQDALVEAARFATAAAALSVQRLGAVPSIPRREDIEAFLAG